jgi:AcrR family transcriptional regulator
MPRGEATRGRIVGAAVKAFAEKGFEAASTRELAQRAGVDQGLLTYHFPSKDELWRAAADRLFALLGKRLDARLASLERAKPRERSREAIREYVRSMAAHPEFFRFLVDRGNRADARTRWLVDTHIKPRFEFMQQVGSLIFAVPANCRRLTGVDPRKPEAIEAHAEFVANLMVP